MRNKIVNDKWGKMEFGSMMGILFIFAKLAYEHIILSFTLAHAVWPHSIYRADILLNSWLTMIETQKR